MKKPGLSLQEMMSRKRNRDTTMRTRMKPKSMRRVRQNKGKGVRKKNTFKVVLESPCAVKWKAVPTQVSKEVLEILKNGLVRLTPVYTKETTASEKNGEGSKINSDTHSNTNTSNSNDSAPSKGASDGDSTKGKRAGKSVNKKKHGTDTASAGRCHPGLCIGINAVTRAMERGELALAVLCREVKPDILIDHFPVLSSVTSTPIISLPLSSLSISLPLPPSAKPSSVTITSAALGFKKEQSEESEGEVQSMLAQLRRKKFQRTKSEGEGRAKLNEGFVPGKSALQHSHRHLHLPGRDQDPQTQKGSAGEGEEAGDGSVTEVVSAAAVADVPWVISRKDLAEGKRCLATFDGMIRRMEGPRREVDYTKGERRISDTTNNMSNKGYRSREAIRQERQEWKQKQQQQQTGRGRQRSKASNQRTRPAASMHEQYPQYLPLAQTHHRPALAPAPAPAPAHTHTHPPQPLLRHAPAHAQSHAPQYYPPQQQHRQPHHHHPHNHRQHQHPHQQHPQRNLPRHPYY